MLQSKKPVLYVGGGCLESSAEVRELVRLTGIPVAQTLMGLGAFPETDPLALQVGAGLRTGGCVRWCGAGAEGGRVMPRRAGRCYAWKGRGSGSRPADELWMSGFMSVLVILRWTNMACRPCLPADAGHARHCVRQLRRQRGGPADCSGGAVRRPRDG